MPTRAYIAALLGLMINAVIFSIGAATVLSVPALAADAALYLPLVILLSLNLTPAIAWAMAPRLQAVPARRERPIVRSIGRVPVPLVRPSYGRAFRNARTLAL